MFATFVKHWTLFYAQIIKNVSQNVSHYIKYVKIRCKTLLLNKNMAKNIEIGEIGESLAIRYLLNNKYKVLSRNYRETWGEIDIIAKDRDGALVFVEVKTMRTHIDANMFHANVKQQSIDSGLKPEDNLSWSKLNKVKRTAYLYANSHPELINDDKGWRIDLIAIEINHQNPELLKPTELKEHSIIRHYKGIVE